MPAHCATERRSQGTIRQRRIFGIGDASPDADDAWAAHLALKPAEEASSSRSQSAAMVPDVNAPSRTVRPPFGLFDPFSAGLGQFQPTAFKTPVHTSVATEFNSREHAYNTIKPRSPSIPKTRQIGREASKGPVPTTPRACPHVRNGACPHTKRGLSPRVEPGIRGRPACAEGRRRRRAQGAAAAARRRLPAHARPRPARRTRRWPGAPAVRAIQTGSSPSP